MKLAVLIEDVFGEITPPPQISGIGEGALGINQILSKIVELIYIAAGVVFVFMVIISAFQWIVSGGEKEAVGNARNRLTHAIVGIIILGLAFVILRVIGQIIGFEFFTSQSPSLPLPTPTPYPLPTPYRPGIPI
ncbi:pilin [Patescibacteria group bacterium]|nr:pilin [Patescibacteria group bacterium]